MKAGDALAPFAPVRPTGHSYHVIPEVRARVRELKRGLALLQVSFALRCELMGIRSFANALFEWSTLWRWLPWDVRGGDRGATWARGMYTGVFTATMTLSRH